jgi:membrane-bound lytic murein transglycosylase D
MKRYTSYPRRRRGHGLGVVSPCVYILSMILVVSMHPPTAYTESDFEELYNREEVQHYIGRFLTRERAFLERGLKNAEIYLPTVRELFRGEGLPEELVYLPLIESAFSPRAVSRAGAAGLWQFMPSTARWQGLRIDFWVDERRDPVKSTSKAIAHLRYLYGYYEDWALALAAYNAGMGSVNLAVKRAHSRDFWVLAGSGYIKRETREYVPRFVASALIARNPQRFGFKLSENTQFTDHEVLEIDKTLDLTVLSRSASIPLGTLQFLNPELRRLITPLGQRYSLRVPKDRFAEALRVYHELPAEDLVGVTRYTVRYGDTLGEIAERYDTGVALLGHLNNIYNPRVLYAGQTLLVPITSERGEVPEIQTSAPRRGFDTQEILYTVQHGDTLWEIARRYNSDIETILCVNGMNFSSVIRPGDEITLWLDLAFTP